MTCDKADLNASGSAARPQASLACAVLLGVAMAEVGVSVMHDANHGAGGAGARGVLGATLDMVLRPLHRYSLALIKIIPTSDLHETPRCNL